MTHHHMDYAADVACCLMRQPIFSHFVILHFEIQNENAIHTVEVSGKWGFVHFISALFFIVCSYRLQSFYAYPNVLIINPHVNRVKLKMADSTLRRVNRWKDTVLCKEHQLISSLDMNESFRSTSFAHQRNCESSNCSQMMMIIISYHEEPDHLLSSGFCKLQFMRLHINNFKHCSTLNSQLN